MSELFPAFKPLAYLVCIAHADLPQGTSWKATMGDNGQFTTSAKSAITDVVVTVNVPYPVKAGQVFEGVTDGQSSALLGGSVSAGNPLVVGTNGKYVASAPASGVNHLVTAQALEDGSADQLISVKLVHYVNQGA